MLLIGALEAAEKLLIEALEAADEPLIEAPEVADGLPGVPPGLVEDESVAFIALLPKAPGDELDDDGAPARADRSGAGGPPGFPDADGADGRFEPETGFAPDARAPELVVPDVVGRAPDSEPIQLALPAGGDDPTDPPDPAGVDGLPSDPPPWPAPLVASGADDIGLFAPAIDGDRPPGDEVASGPVPLAAEVPGG